MTVAPISSSEAEPKSSAGIGRLETPAHGYGKLKRGNEKNLTGRPKKEVRDDTLQAVSRHALPWAMRVMANDDILDDSPVKARAAEILFRFGLGTQDEVVKLDDAKVPAAVAQVLGSLIGQTMTKELAQAAANEMASLLGLQAP